QRRTRQRSPRRRAEGLPGDPDAGDDEEEGEGPLRPPSMKGRRRPAMRGRTGELSLQVVPLSAAGQERYLRRWGHFRAEFVEEPYRTAERTDAMVQDLLFDR